MLRLVLVSYIIFSIFEAFLISLQDGLISTQQSIIQYHLSKPLVVRNGIALYLEQVLGGLSRMIIIPK